ncbi:hypothetical protein [Bradyrhizobium sp. USDA 336]|uniref:hypothetical protein n=1 Tax=Bradyrhizobium sp. USDA 336 TaxID=3156311 RepID=UPI003834C168
MKRQKRREKMEASEPADTSAPEGSETARMIGYAQRLSRLLALRKSRLIQAGRETLESWR